MKNLYYTGQCNHPSMEVPTSIISSRVLVKELKKRGFYHSLYPNKKN